jgi:multidrug transporter EmrE-like cation transporter
MSSSEPSAGSVAPRAGEVSAWLTPVELVALGAIWGASFLFMRVSAKDFGPFPLVEIRLALGAVILLPFLWQARAQFNAGLWLRLAGIAAINSAIPFTLFAWGAERAPAGIGAITNAMAVPFTAMVAFMFFGEQVGLRRAWGLALGFVGVVVLASGRTGGGWFNGVACGPRGDARGAVVWSRRQPVEALSRGGPGERGGLSYFCMCEFACCAVGDHDLAATSDSCGLVGECGAAGGGVHGAGVCFVLPPHSSHRRASRGDGDVHHSVVRSGVGVDASGRSTHAEHGGSGSVDSVGRGAQSDQGREKARLKVPQARPAAVLGAGIEISTSIASCQCSCTARAPSARRRVTQAR